MIREPRPLPDAPKLNNQAPGEQSSPCSAVIDRRREARYTTNDPVEVQLLEAGGALPVDGKVLDVSRNGLRLELPTHIGQGLRVKIVLFDRTIIFGEVRYCRYLSPVYHLGVAIEAVYFAQPTLGDHLHDTKLNLYLLRKGADCGRGYLC